MSRKRPRSGCRRTVDSLPTASEGLLFLREERIKGGPMGRRHEVGSEDAVEIAPDPMKGVEPRHHDN